jgi:hypothetical protein
MNVKEEIERRRMPCGPVTVAIEGVCRRRLKDKFDTILGKLSELTDQEYKAPQAPEGHEMVDGKIMSKEQLKEQQHEEKRGDLLKKGIMRNEVAAEVAKHREEVMPKKEEKKEPTLEERKKEMLKEAKMKAEVKIKAKEHEKRLEGNSKLLQDTSGKINKR